MEWPSQSPDPNTLEKGAENSNNPTTTYNLKGLERFAKRRGPKSSPGMAPLVV